MSLAIDILVLYTNILYDQLQHKYDLFFGFIFAFLLTLFSNWKELILRIAIGWKKNMITLKEKYDMLYFIDF